MNYFLFFHTRSLGLFFACADKQQLTGPFPPRSVKVVQIRSFATIQKTYTGIVQAEEFSTLAFKVAGSLTFTANAIAKQNLEIAEADYVKASSALHIAERTRSYTRIGVQSIQKEQKVTRLNYNKN